MSTTVAKELPKSGWYKENNENWQFDDFLLNQISVSMINKKVQVNMEDVETILLKLIELGYCI